MADRYGFQSPGAAMQNAIAEELLRRELMKRQAQQDQIAAEQRQQQTAQQGESNRRADAMLTLQQQQEARIAAAQQQQQEERQREAQLARLREQDQAGARRMIGIGAFGGEMTPERARSVAQMAYSEGLPTPGIVDQAFKPKPQPDNIDDAIFMETDPAKRAELLKIKRQMAQAEHFGSGASGPPDQVWVTRDGKLTPIQKGTARPGDVPFSQTGARAITGAERKTLGFFNRMLDAERNARAVEDEVGGRDFAAEYAPGEVLENFFKSESGQKYSQAQRTFTEGRLRKESGAAIPQKEYDTDRDTNFKRPGDKSLDQKRASRLQLLRSAANEAGRALEEYYGEGTTIDSLLSEFSSAPAAKVITRAQLRAIAAKNKVSEAEAEAQARAQGYTVQ